MKTQKISKHDQKELDRFAEFLREVGGLPKGDPEKHAKLRTWLRKDPKKNRKYLGLTKAEVKGFGLE